jgi:hypothetical protein
MQRKGRKNPLLFGCHENVIAKLLGFTVDIQRFAGLSLAASRQQRGLSGSMGKEPKSG